MLCKLMKSPAQWAWLLIGATIPLWCAAVAGTSLTQLTLSAPFVLLGPSFWLGLTMAAVAFFVAQGTSRVAALFVLAWYFIATVVFVYPYPVMHDSIVNTLLFPSAEGFQYSYSVSYIGLSAVIAWIEQLGEVGPWEVARFFPVGMLLAYFLAIGLIVVSWRSWLFTSSFACTLFVLFFFVFGDVYYLRINPAPQTIGFLSYLIALGLLPLSSRSVLLKAATLIALGATIISHPSTPILAIPGLILVMATCDKTKAPQIQRALELTIVFLCCSVTWTLYRAGWIITSAIKSIANAFTEEKSIPIINSPVIPQIAGYILLHRIFLIVLLIVLAVGYFSIWKSRAWYFVTAWGLALLPGFVLLFSYHEFFDRILLFMLVPCAVVFAESGEHLCQRFPRLKVPAAAVVMALMLLSASVAYFGIGSVDRVTQDEIDATRYLASLDRPLHVYAGGFNIPISEDLKFVYADRGSILLEDVQRADAVITSRQVNHAVMLFGRSKISTDQLLAFLQHDYIKVYESSDVRVFLKRTIAGLK